CLAFTVRVSAQNGNGNGNGNGRGHQVVTGEILVKFKPGSNANAKAEAHRVARGLRKNGIPRTNIELVSGASGDEAAAIAPYKRNPNVLYAEPNYVRTIPMRTVTDAQGSPFIPSDLNFNQQWSLNNTGQEFYCIDWIFGPLCFYMGTPDADIDAPEAWEISTG